MGKSRNFLIGNTQFLVERLYLLSLVIDRISFRAFGGGPGKKALWVACPARALGHFDPCQSLGARVYPVEMDKRKAVAALALAALMPSLGAVVVQLDRRQATQAMVSVALLDAELDPVLRGLLTSCQGGSAQEAIAKAAGVRLDPPSSSLVSRTAASSPSKAPRCAITATRCTRM
jgi:hypothetical protein